MYICQQPNSYIRRRLCLLLLLLLVCSVQSIGRASIPWAPSAGHVYRFLHAALPFCLCICVILPLRLRPSRILFAVPWNCAVALIELIVLMTPIITSSQWYVGSCTEDSAGLFADCSHVIKFDLRQTSGTLPIQFRSNCNRLYICTRRGLLTTPGLSCDAKQVVLFVFLSRILRVNIRRSHRALEAGTMRTLSVFNRTVSNRCTCPQSSLPFLRSPA